jgi:hypothetical protein
VASEDSVLFAAEQYASSFSPNPQQVQSAQQILARVVRAQHLSQFWLSASALSPSTPTTLLGSYAAQLGDVLMLKAGMGSIGLANTDLQTLIPGSPDSWREGQRSIRAMPAVDLTWKLDISTVSGAGQSSAWQQQVTLKSPETTPPIGGLVYGIQVIVDWVPEANGCEVSVYAAPRNAPAGTFHRFRFSLTVAGNVFGPAWSPVMLCGGTGWPITQGAMAGGWDAAAWAQAGLPTSGELVMKLQVIKVAHSC